MFLEAGCAVYDLACRKYLTTAPVVVKEVPSHGVLSAQLVKEEMPSIDGIPTVQNTVVAVDELPVGYDFYIVSALYLSAAMTCGKDVSKLLTIGDPVYTAEGLKPCGALNLQRHASSKNSESSLLGDYIKIMNEMGKTNTPREGLKVALKLVHFFETQL
ncbi:MAG: hypothetical protein NUV82_01305 [Candidatus Komeilibacteria bacterium]|nr:hypothetical protein [Candidatus Komeilibacteria bacterium]